MSFGYLLESPQRGDSNKYSKHIFCEEIRTKQYLSYISFCLIKDSLQQQIHYNGNIFGNKFCRCNVVYVGSGKTQFFASRRFGDLLTNRVLYEDSYQTVRMRRMIGVFAGRTFNLVGNAVSRLILYNH